MMDTPIRVVIMENYPLMVAGLRSILEVEDDIEFAGATAQSDKLFHLIPQSNPDIVLLDVSATGNLYLELVKRLCQHFPETHVLVIVDDCNKVCMSDLVKAGIKGCLVKCDPPSRWVQAIRRLAEDKTALSPAAVEKFIRENILGSALGREIGLTERQQEVVQMIAQGMSTSQIAAALNISERTVKYHLSNTYRRLGVSGRAEAIIWAWQQRFEGKI